MIIGGSGGDHGVRYWLAALDPKTGEVKWKTFAVPAPGEPGSETWKDKVNAWQTGGGAFYVTGSYDPGTNLTYWGSGNPAPRYDSAYRPGDNLFTDSTIAFDAATGKMKWYHQYTPNDIHDYDASGSQIIISSQADGEDRKIVSLANRNGFQYSFDSRSGEFLKATQYAEKVDWTKGIDAKTGKPLDYDPTKDVQIYNNDWKGGTDKMLNSCPTCTAAPISGRRRTARRRTSFISAATKAAPTSFPTAPPTCWENLAAAVTSTMRASPVASPCSIRCPARSRSARTCRMATSAAC